MPGLTSIGGRGRLVAVSCAAVSTAVVVSWHMRARRRASTSLRASLTVGGLNAPSRASDNNCDALEKLATEFQVPSLPGVRELLRLLTRRGSRRLQVVRHGRTCSARTSNACSCTPCTSKLPWGRAPRRRRRGWTSLPTPSGASRKPQWGPTFSNASSDTPAV